MTHVAQKFNLYPDIQFNTCVNKATYDKIKNVWHVYTAAGECFSAKYLVTAVGCIASASVPQIDGLNTFDGICYHTAQWPHEGVDFKGKHVGLVGTGSTGIQAIPVIAEQAASSTVFQRTANFSVPARNAPLSDEFKQYVKENSGQIRDIMHSNHNGLPINRSDRSVFDCTEEERNAIYEEAWNQGGMQFRATFRDLLSDSLANATAANFIKSKIKLIVKDSVTADVLSDIDHPFAAKRPPIDTNYFETFNRENVSIVNLRKTPIENITSKGIQTSDKHFEFDVIVFATGFDAITGPLLKLNIQGSEGLKLAEVWQDGPRSYLGLQVPGFPNLFTITGPGSPSVLGNVPVAIEQHVDWITDCIAHLKSINAQLKEPSEEATSQWHERVQEAANATLLSQVNSWYLGANIPGKPRVFMPYAGGFANYRRICADVANENYKGFVIC